MRRLILLTLVAVLALPAYAAKRVTVDQLEQILNASKGKPDAEVAQHLSDLELTERLSSTRLAHWKAALPGGQAQEALVALADASEFLNPPASEIPATAPPDLAAQRQMLALTVNYVVRTIHLLPNFFATRVTTSFEDTPLLQKVDSFIPYQPLHLVGGSSVTMLYRDGHEAVDTGAAKDKKPEGLTTWGVFGPILGTVLEDAARSKLVWSHWELGTSGPMAVFSYSVPQEKSHYKVNFCCVAEQAATRVADLYPFSQIVAYHGEMAVDPDSGTILRLMLEAELKTNDPITRASIVVEYGPVEIGGRTYFCPVRSISSSLAQTLQFNQRFLYPLAGQLQPLKTMLNDIAFEQYHLFRAEARIVTGDAAETKPANAENINSNSVAVNPAEAAAEQSASSASPMAGAAPSAPAVAGNGAAPVSPSTPAPEQEIAVTEASGVPDAPVNPSMPQPSGFTIKVTSRLVDLSIVAYDKKGHPVRDLKQQEIEVYDNGRKQELRFFSPIADQLPAAPAAAPAPERSFSNRSMNATPAWPAAEIGSTVLIIDESHIAWSDLNNARQQMLKFFASVPPTERVGIYTMTTTGFRVLQEITTDHAALTARLLKWMPTAQSISQAQGEETHNRQTFNEVQNLADLDSVNGNLLDESAGAIPIDPQLLNQGSNPARASLIILVAVARHLATLPGHKSLVWVSSDNVFADWSDQDVSVDKGDKYLDGYALHAQEAMNDAHAAVYPFDVSQIETAAIGADIQHRNVEPIQAITSSMGGGALPRNETDGRITAQMHQDVHPIQTTILQVADATGGRTIRRSSDLADELSGIVDDGRAAVRVSFSPQGPADGQYHHITVKLTGRQRGLTLRYRTGYLYSKEPGTLKEHFHQAVWEPLDANQVAVSAKVVTITAGADVTIEIAATDLGLEERAGHWTDKLDVFFIQRDDAGLRAQVEGRTVGLRLKSSTYQNLLSNGLPIERIVQMKPAADSLRILVVDENTGRMGSVTIPASALQAGH